MSVSNTHLFCITSDCGNTAVAGTMCAECSTHVCNGEWDYDLGYRVCDNSDDEDCPQHEPRCTCDGSGRMCDFCADECAEPCRGCGVRCQLWVDERYCRDCHRERYGVPENKSVHKSLQEMRDEIAEIEARLRSNMTKGQKDDWIWILQNRRADLADAEKELWEQYDKDDLRKMDQANRRGF